MPDNIKKKKKLRAGRRPRLRRPAVSLSLRWMATKWCATRILVTRTIHSLRLREHISSGHGEGRYAHYACSGRVWRARRVRAVDFLLFFIWGHMTRIMCLFAWSWPLNKDEEKMNKFLYWADQWPKVTATRCGWSPSLFLFLHILGYTNLLMTVS